jgi:hypothetical protein
MSHQPFFPSSQAVLGYLEEVKAKVRSANSPVKLLEAITEFSDVMRVNTFFQSTEWVSKLAEARTSVQIELLAGLRSAAEKISQLEAKLGTQAESATPLFDSIENPQTGTLSFPPTAGVLSAVAPQQSAVVSPVVMASPQQSAVVSPVVMASPQHVTPVAQSIKPPETFTADDFLTNPDVKLPDTKNLFICKKCKRKHVGYPEGGVCEDCQHGAFKIAPNPDYEPIQQQAQTSTEFAHDLQQMVDESASETKPKVESKSDQTALKFFTVNTREMASCDEESCGSDNLKIEAPVPDHREQYTVKYRCLDCDHTGSFPCSKAELVVIAEAQKSVPAPPNAQSSPSNAEPPKRGRPRKSPKVDPQPTGVQAQAPAEPTRANFLTPKPQPPASAQVKATVDRIVRYDPPGVNPVTLRDAVLASMRSWPPEKLIQEWETLLKKIYDPQVSQPDQMRQDIANFIAGVTTPGVPEPEETAAQV